ncbi:CBS domain-containing protein [Candidatus Peregrinibacteria bacterium]|nr:CBS domain-containing protein [Candidatus Peregrinibacteria bacterium]
MPKTLLAKNIMTKPVISFTEKETIENVIKILSKTHITGAPVVNKKNHVIGMVTEKDIALTALSPHIPKTVSILGGIIMLENPGHFNSELKKICASKVKDIMRTPCESIEDDTTLQNIILLMSEKNLNRLPVTKKKKLVGIITRTNILQALKTW